jgi:hypothetical protein
MVNFFHNNATPAIFKLELVLYNLKRIALNAKNGKCQNVIDQLQELVQM